MICRGFTINGRRTSVRMEKCYWEALEDVARRRGLPMKALIADVDRTRGDGSLTDSLRLAALTYFRGLVSQLDQYGMLRAETNSIPRPRFRSFRRRLTDQASAILPEHSTVQ